MDSDTRSPARTEIPLNGPTFTSAGPCASPLANCWRIVPRRRFRDHVTPLPHSGWAGATEAAMFMAPVIGLRHPTAARSVGEGCTATLCGFMLPGIRTILLEELATSEGVSLLPQPLTISKPPTPVSLF